MLPPQSRQIEAAATAAGHMRLVVVRLLPQSLPVLRSVRPAGQRRCRAPFAAYTLFLRRHLALPAYTLTVWACASQAATAAAAGLPTGRMGSWRTHLAAVAERLELHLYGCGLHACTGLAAAAALPAYSLRLLFQAALPAAFALKARPVFSAPNANSQQFSFSLRVEDWNECMQRMSLGFESRAGAALQTRKLPALVSIHVRSSFYSSHYGPLSPCRSMAARRVRTAGSTAWCHAALHRAQQHAL